MATKTVKANVTTMQVLALCADAERGELVENYYTFDTPLTDKKVIKAIKEELTGSDLVLVKVKEKKLVTEKYEMPKTEFIKNATKVED